MHFNCLQLKCAMICKIEKLSYTLIWSDSRKLQKKFVIIEVLKMPMLINPNPNYYLWSGLDSDLTLYLVKTPIGKIIKTLIQFLDD